MKTSSLLILFVGLIITTPLALAADKACTECHDPPLLKSRPHEGALWGCDTCHTPHVSYSQPAGLVAKIDALCFQCHDRKRILGECAAPDGSDCGHPVIKTRDPLYPNKNFTCVSCHNPHSSEAPHLFRYDYQSQNSPYRGNECAVCHWGKVFATPQPSTPPWNE